MSKPSDSPRPLSSLRSVWFLVILLGISVLALYGVRHAYLATDWLALRNYNAPSDVSTLADQTTMTPKARHLFYINHPAVQDKQTFNTNCDKFGEQTIVLGCYHGVQRGIYVLSVSDGRLQGVEQVTAAHEMLHAAYDRMAPAQKQQVDAQLQDYAAHQLSDDRIRAVLKGYETSEPGQQLNEMHSIFGTEVKNLPAPLEAYYAQYFADRSRVVQYAAQYQAAFTSRQSAIKAYDAQLSKLGDTIKANTTQLTSQQAAIEATSRQLESYRSSGDIERYNSGVGAYNATIDAYNKLLVVTKQQIAQYNKIVADRNAIALQTQELQQAIDSTKLPDTK